MTGAGGDFGDSGNPERLPPVNPYAPIDYPEYPPPPTGYPPPPPGYPAPYPGVPATGPPGYPGYPAAGSPYDPYGQGIPPGTNGMAIASLVTSLTGVFFCGIPGIVGLVLGIIAMGQCRRTGQEGHGMAVAGTIIGGVITVLALIVFIVWLIAVVAAGSSSTY